MLTHIILTVADVGRSLAFYDAALQPLGIRYFLPYKGVGGEPDLYGFGDGQRAFFWLRQGNPAPGSIHWGLRAESRDKVREFFQAALSAGAKESIAPRIRREYSADYYAAEVIDPDGYSFEVVHRNQ
ncbi:MAG: VOC family protein [Acidobacteriota bacterium]|nr:VOC family protein [Acidobacteriota bacterium]